MNVQYPDAICIASIRRVRDASWGMLEIVYERDFEPGWALGINEVSLAICKPTDRDSLHF